MPDFIAADIRRGLTVDLHVIDTGAWGPLKHLWWHMRRVQMRMQEMRHGTQAHLLQENGLLRCPLSHVHPGATHLLATPQPLTPEDQAAAAASLARGMRR